MHGEYVEARNGGFYLAGTRVSLESVLYAFKQGNSPELILERFPAVVKLARIYGAIAFYLDRPAEIDEYLERSRREFEASIGPPLAETNPALWERLQRGRAQLALDIEGAPRS